MFVESIKEIHVEPTTFCQAECSMCARTVLNYHSTEKHLNTELSLRKFQQLTEHLISGLEKILFCGTLDAIRDQRWAFENGRSLQYLVDGTEPSRGFLLNLLKG